MTQPAYPPAQSTGKPPNKLTEAVGADWIRSVVRVVNGILMGKMNASLPVTLAASAGTTTVKDARITAYSTLILQPLTTHAAAALYASPYVLLTNQQTGSVVLNHVNDANTDKNFNLLIIG